MPSTPAGYRRKSGDYQKCRSPNPMLRVIRLFRASGKMRGSRLGRFSLPIHINSSFAFLSSLAFISLRSYGRRGALVYFHRCEERSDEAIQSQKPAPPARMTCSFGHGRHFAASLDCFVVSLLAMTG
jgi:hypothetical protein